ncbi:MAG: endo-1,4-beta-xylanase [Victivallales bacterium]|nr:endo-1,4-beta-xylanase [Victivallales bacterium]
MNETATLLTKYLFRDDPEVDFRIETGTAANRKGFAKLRLFCEGKPVEGAQINYRQISHQFRFGANLFMLDQFGNDEENAKYRERFASLFNFATVPFYWSDLEPEQGKPRFRKDAPPIYRRPPPDLCVEFCKEHNIGMKGHCLLWQTSMPKWASNDRRELEVQIEKRFREIGERYSRDIRVWDVVNENGSYQDGWRYMLLNQDMPENHYELAFKLAEKYFPNCELLHNDSFWPQRQCYSMPLLLTENLLNKGCKVDGIGTFLHQSWNGKTNFDAMMQGAHAISMNAMRILRALDALGRLGLPVNVSEITINGYLGDDYQEQVLERLYRLYFSHPATNGIFYWNLVDDTAYVGVTCDENNAKGGLLRRDFSPKPAWKTLERLIKQEWTCSGTLKYHTGEANKFHGFYGKYELEIKTEFGTFRREINLSKSSENRFEISL